MKTADLSFVELGKARRSTVLPSDFEQREYTCEELRSFCYELEGRLAIKEEEIKAACSEKLLLRLQHEKALESLSNLEQQFDTALLLAAKNDPQVRWIDEDEIDEHRKRGGN